MSRVPPSVRIGLEFDHDHVVAVVPEGRFLVDTGCPASFGNCPSVTYGTRQYQIGSGLPTPDGRQITTQSLEPLNLMVDGLIGMDIIRSTPVIWDLGNGLAEIGPFGDFPVTGRIPMSLTAGAFPIVDLTIEGRSIKALFDTGAQCGYAERGLFDGEAPVGSLRDCFVLLGTFIETPIWQKSVVVGDTILLEKFGVPSDDLAKIITSGLKASAILGCSWMPGHRVWFDAANSAMFIE